MVTGVVRVGEQFVHSNKIYYNQSKKALLLFCIKGWPFHAKIVYVRQGVVTSHFRSTILRQRD